MNIERKLNKIATQGGTYVLIHHYYYMMVSLLYEPIISVVQLFNAVNKHQQSLTEKVKKAGPLESKRVKGTFNEYVYVTQHALCAHKI